MLMNQFENQLPEASGRQAGLKIKEFEIKCNKKADLKINSRF